MGTSRDYKYTELRRKSFEEKFYGMKMFCYCRGDFIEVIKKLNSKDVPKDRKKSLRAQLEKMCKARGFEKEELCKSAKETADKLKTIPTRAQILDELLSNFHSLYSEGLSTADVMERIVRELAPEYKEDTVRTAILKKFLAGAQGEDLKQLKTKQIMEWAKKKLSSSEQQSYDSFTEEQKRELLISKIDDSIFKHEKAETSEADIFCFVAKMMKKYIKDSKLKDFKELKLSPEVSEAAKEVLEHHKLEVYDLEGNEISDTEKVSGIAEGIKNGNIPEIYFTKNPDFAEAYPDFVERVEDEFRNQLRTVKLIKKNGKEGNAAEKYTQAKKDENKKGKKDSLERAAKKESGLDCELVDMCHNLANGNFQVNGKTKVNLYYFAFMFEMTFSLPGETEKVDPKRDIVKNLFHDYYNDNVFRFFNADYADPEKARTFEKEPTGEGINYKNYREVIYLYYLGHDEGKRTPGEKIQAAEKIIEECVNRAKEGQRPRETVRCERTEDYRNEFEDLFYQEEEKLAEYVAAHYVIPSSGSQGTRIRAGSKQETVYGEVVALKQDYENEKNENDNGAMDGEVEKPPMEFDWKVKECLEKKFPEDTEFLNTVARLDERVHSRNWWHNKNEKRQMIMLLHILATTKGPVTTRTIRDEMTKKRIEGEKLSTKIKKLREIGFDISDDGKKEKKYYLGERTYADSELTAFLNSVAVRKNFKAEDISEDMERKMTKLLDSGLQPDKRIGRNELISSHFNKYIEKDLRELIGDPTDEEESTGIISFEDVYKNYKRCVNEVLEKAGYQLLSEKNIFDVYVVIALFYYLVEVYNSVEQDKDRSPLDF